MEIQFCGIIFHERFGYCITQIKHGKNKRAIKNWSTLKNRKWLLHATVAFFKALLHATVAFFKALLHATLAPHEYKAKRNDLEQLPG